MLKRFVPQKPMPPVREEPRFSGPDENNHPANGEEPIITSTIIDKPKPMADHGGKDILSSDVEIKGSIKFQKELLIDGKVEGEINSDGADREGNPVVSVRWPIRRLQKSVLNVHTVASSRWSMQRRKARFVANAGATSLHLRRNPA